MAALVPYGEYYASNRLANEINDVGDKFGLPGKIVAHSVIAGSGLVVPQVEGLVGDVAVDEIKGHSVNTEGANDEGIRGHLLPRWIVGGGPVIYLPGIHEDWSVDIEY